MSITAEWYSETGSGSFFDDVFGSETGEQTAVMTTAPRLEIAPAMLALIEDGARNSTEIAQEWKALQQRSELDDTLEQTPVSTPSIDPMMTMVMHIEPSGPAPEPKEAVEEPEPKVDPDADTIELHLVQQPEAQTEPQPDASYKEGLERVLPYNIRVYPARYPDVTSSLPRHLSPLPPLDRTKVVDALAVQMVEAVDTSASGDVVWSKELAEVYPQLWNLEASKIVIDHSEIRDFINQASKRQPGEPVPDPRVILAIATEMAEQAELSDAELRDHDKNVEAIEKYQSKPGMSYYVESKCPEEAAIIDDPETPLSKTATIYRRLWLENREAILELAAKENLVDPKKYDIYNQEARRLARAAQRRAAESVATEEDETPAVLISDAPAPVTKRSRVVHIGTIIPEVTLVTNDPQNAVSPTQTGPAAASHKSVSVVVANRAAKPEIEAPVIVEMDKDRIDKLQSEVSKDKSALKRRMMNTEQKIADVARHHTPIESALRRFVNAPNKQEFKPSNDWERRVKRTFFTKSAEEFKKLTDTFLGNQSPNVIAE